MDPLSDIRIKRLNYFQKLLTNANKNQDESKLESDSIPAFENAQLDKFEFKNKSNDEFIERRNSLNEITTNKSNKFNIDDNNNDSVRVLNKIFGSFEARAPLRSSVSFDESNLLDRSTNLLSSNPRLEEFKRVVEKSYQQHVVNKNDHLNSSIFGPNQEDILSNSSKMNFFSNSTQYESSTNFTNDQFNTELNSHRPTENKPNSSSSSCRIPYMSAYNIYQPLSRIPPQSNNFLNDNQSTVTHLSTMANVSMPIFQETNSNLKIDLSIANEDQNVHKFSSTNKEFSSNGSSLTTSPTSVSSSDSIKKQTEVVVDNTQNISYNNNNTQTPLVAKPPSTPRTSSVATNYRKNLLAEKMNRLSINTSTTPLNKSIELQSNQILFQNNNNESTNVNYTNQENELMNFLNDQLMKASSAQIQMPETSPLKYKRNTLEPIVLNKAINLNSSIQNNNNKSSSKRDENIFTHLKSSQSNKLEKISNSYNATKRTSNNNKKLAKLNTDIKSRNNANNNNNNKFKNNHENDEIDGNDTDADGSDTFDMFSSHDSLDLVGTIGTSEKNENTLNKKRLDLTIDLGLLSGGDDDDKDDDLIKFVNKKVDPNMSPSDSLNSSLDLNNSARQFSKHIQVKPENIPNLMLDLMDDDKSQSVAVSLAKSMCKEIDYQKEMEQICKQNDLIENKKEKITDETRDNSQEKPSNSSTKRNAIKLNSLKNPVLPFSIPNTLIHTNKYQNHLINHDTNIGNKVNYTNNGYKNSSNIKQINEGDSKVRNDESNNMDYFLKPPKSSRLSTARQENEPVKTNQQMINRPKTSNKKLNNEYLPNSTDINEIIEIQKPSNIKPNSTSVKFEISTENSENTAVLNGTTPQIMSKDTNSNLRKSAVWRPSTSVILKKPTIARPKSAFSKYSNQTNNETKKEQKLKANEEQATSSTQPVQQPPNNNLFFDYSKLVAIETNLQKQLEDEQQQIEVLNRPKSSLSKIPTQAVNLVFDLPDLDDTKNENKTRQPRHEDKNDENKQEVVNELPVFGDQESYKKIAENIIEAKDLSSEFMKPEVDWLSLPDEIWLNIITYLKHPDLVRFGQTCKGFNKLYTDSTLWRSVTVKYQYNMCDEWLKWIGKRRPNELNIVQCSGNITLNAISEMFCNIGTELKKLNLSRCSNGSLSGDNFALQASIRCPNVDNLDLSWTLLSNQTLKLIIDSFRRIQSINLSGCNMIQEDGFNLLLLTHGESLRNLEISGCIHFSSNCILNISVYCRDLERLNISNCHRMTNESIIEACPQWQKLKYLDLRGIKNIKNNCVSTLVRKCSQLEGLALGECIHIGDGSILEIATYKPNIKYLDLNGCKKISDNAIKSLANFCFFLEYLNLKATNITDMGIITLSNGKCMKTLEELNLSYLPISEFVLTKLLRCSEKLKQIHLYGCYNIKHIEDIKKVINEKAEKHLTINI